MRVVLLWFLGILFTACSSTRYDVRIRNLSSALVEDESNPPDKPLRLKVYRDSDETPRWALDTLNVVVRTWRAYEQPVSFRCYQHVYNARIEVWDPSATEADGFCWDSDPDINIAACAYGKSNTIQIESDESLHTLAHEYTHLLGWCVGLDGAYSHEGDMWDVWLPFTETWLDGDTPIQDRL